MLATAYSDDYELFAEISPLSVGEESTIAAHFTRLSDFKPASDQSVSGVFSVGGDTALSGAIEGGIAKISITPSAAGEGSISFTIDGQTLSAPVTVYPTDEEADEAAEEAEISSSNGVSFTKEKSWKIDFSTAEARLEPFGQVIRTAGRVLPSQSREQVVTATASGIVSLSGNVLPGSRVRSGQVLFTISGKSLADDNAAVRYAQIKAEYERARSEYERIESLSGSNIVSASELSAAKAAYESAKAEYDNMSKTYNGVSYNVSAEIAGSVTSVSVTNGEYVQAGQRLAVVSSSEKVYVQARVQPKYRHDLEGACDAVFSVHGRSCTMKELDGRIVSVADAAAADDPMLPVTFEVSNRADLVQGTFIDVYIKTVGSATAVTVGNDAIIEEMGNWFVYRQLTPEFFEKTQVSVGATDGLRTEITSGLEAGDRVVEKGAIIVKLAQSAGGLDAHAGHVH